MTRRSAEASEVERDGGVCGCGGFDCHGGGCFPRGDSWEVRGLPKRDPQGEGGPGQRQKRTRGFVAGKARPERERRGRWRERQAELGR